jgi:hypothetical protein
MKFSKIYFIKINNYLQEFKTKVLNIYGLIFRNKLRAGNSPFEGGRGMSKPNSFLA